MASEAQAEAGVTVLVLGKVQAQATAPSSRLEYGPRPVQLDLISWSRHFESMSSRALQHGLEAS